MAIAFAVVLPIVLLRKKLEVPNRKTAWSIVLCGLFLQSDIAVWNIAIQKSTATQATLLANLAPVWVGLLMFFFLPNKPKRNFWIGAVLAVLGMVVLIGFETFYTLKFDIGFLFGILSGIFYAFYILISKSVLRQMQPISFMTYSMAVSAVFIGIICLVSGEPFFGFSPTVWSVLLVEGVVCQLIAWLLISYATQQHGSQSGFFEFAFAGAFYFHHCLVVFKRGHHPSDDNRRLHHSFRDWDYVL